MFKLNLPEKYCRAAGLWLALLIILYPSAASGKNYELGIKSGVSREVLDYEGDSAELVLREGIDLKLSDSFIFNFTTLLNVNEENSSCTWNLSVKDISGFMDFTSGNYNLHFGSGLMMGRASYSSRDPFSKKISISKENTVSPSNGGNPEYSLYGTVFDFHKTFEDIKIYLIPFFSSQRRFITSESFEEGAIDSSLFTLNTKIRKSGNYTEPVNIINYGGALGIRTSALFNIQFYYFETDLKGDSGKDILWDKDKYYGGVEGVDLIRNSGLFAEYTDNNISMFIEPAMSSIENGETVTSFALAWGMGIQNSVLSFSLKGKNCGTNFHSEYSSGSRTPERIWEARCGIFPFTFFETGFIVYSEKDLIPANNRDYTDGSVQEEIFASGNSDIFDINLNAKRKEHYSADREDSADQGNISAGLNLSDRYYFKLRSSVQKCYNETSYLSGGEIKFLFLNYLSLSAGYTRIIINGEVPFYAMVTPASEHSSITAFRESSHGGSINFRYKKEKDSFYIRATVIETDSGRRTGEVESALTLFF